MPRALKIPVPKKKPDKPVVLLHSTLTDITLTNMQKFWLQTDWAQLWSDFYLGMNPDGTRKWKMLYSFIASVAQSPDQKSFLTWYTGPQNSLEKPTPEDIKYSFAGKPQDWVKRRNEEGWFTADNLKRVTSEIRRRNTVLDAMEEVGRSVTLNSVARAEQLAQSIDQYFSGTPLVPDLPLAANVARAEAYIRLQTQVLGLQERAFSLFAKSHGVDFNDLGGLVNFYQAVALSKSARGEIVETKTREQEALEALVQMTLVKSQRYGLPLPEVVETTVVEAAERVETGKKKKRDLQ